MICFRAWSGWHWQRESRFYAHGSRSSGRNNVAHAMGLLAAGTLRVVNDVAWVDGVPGPCRMGEAPRACHIRKGEVERVIPSTCPFIES